MFWLLAGCGLVLAGCGGSRHGHHHHHHHHRRGPAVVAIYSSLPLHGPDAGEGAAVQDGIRLALAQASERAGRFRVSYHALDAARPGAGAWSAAQVEHNAEAASADTRAVYYIGELTSAASEVSMPVLNDAHLAQVSPTATAVGLTTHDPGAGPDEPQRYQPSGHGETFLRIVPNDAVEAAADLEAMHGAGCSRATVAYEPSSYGIGQALTLQQLGADYRLRVTIAPAVGAAEAAAFARTLRSDRIKCFEYAGTSVDSAVALTDAVHDALPTVKLFVPHPLCTPAFTEQGLGGVTPGAALVLECTTIMAPVDAYPGGRVFSAAYRARYGAPASSPALFGYEAMRLGLSTIASLGSRGDERAAVVSALFELRARRSPLGAYGFDSYGDTTLRTIALYRCTSGHPSFYSLLAPSAVLPASAATGG
jgi:branched-chain amino acid transport system substrate-binding protein